MSTKFDRGVNKRLARFAKRYRKALVHAAGCTYRGWAPCSNLSALDYIEPDDFEPGVRIPRSLRQKYFGGRVRT